MMGGQFSQEALPSRHVACRAYNTAAENMYYVQSISFNHEGITRAIIYGRVPPLSKRHQTGMSAAPTQYCYPKNTYFMWWSGALDKNGTKIYEGDIIAYTDPVETKVLEVYHDDELLGFSCRKDNYFTPLPSPENCEIIGNIHENKELLDEHLSES